MFSHLFGVYFLRPFESIILLLCWDILLFTFLFLLSTIRNGIFLYCKTLLSLLLFSYYTLKSPFLRLHYPPLFKSLLSLKNFCLLRLFLNIFESIMLRSKVFFLSLIFLNILMKFFQHFFFNILQFFQSLQVSIINLFQFFLYA